MVSSLGILSLILATALITWVAYSRDPSGVERSVRLVDKARWLIGLIFLGLAAYHLLQSGNVLYVALAMAGVAFLTGYLLIERPWQRTI